MKNFHWPVCAAGVFSYCPSFSACTGNRLSICTDVLYTCYLFACFKIQKYTHTHTHYINKIWATVWIFSQIIETRRLFQDQYQYFFLVKKKSFRFLILMIFGGSWENMMKRVKTTCLKMQYKDASSGSCETVKSPAFTLGQWNFSVTPEGGCDISSGAKPNPLICLF